MMKFVNSSPKGVTCYILNNWWQTTYMSFIFTLTGKWPYASPFKEPVSSSGLSKSFMWTASTFGQFWWEAALLFMSDNDDSTLGSVSSSPERWVAFLSNHFLDSFPVTASSVGKLTLELYSSSVCMSCPLGCLLVVVMVTLTDEDKSALGLDLSLHG